MDYRLGLVTPVPINYKLTIGELFIDSHVISPFDDFIKRFIFVDVKLCRF